MVYIFVHLTYSTGTGLPWPSTWSSLRPDWLRWSRASLWSPLATTRPVAPRAWPSSCWPGLGGRPLPFILTLFSREFPATQEMTRPCWPRLWKPYTTTQISSHYADTTSSGHICPTSPVLQQSTIEWDRGRGLLLMCMQWSRRQQQEVMIMLTRHNFSPLWSVFVLYSCSCPRTCRRLQPRYHNKNEGDFLKMISAPSRGLLWPDAISSS